MNVRTSLLLIALFLSAGCGEPFLLDRAPETRRSETECPCTNDKPVNRDHEKRDTENSENESTASPVDKEFRCDLEFKVARLCAQMNWISGPAWHRTQVEPLALELEFFRPSDTARARLNYRLEFDSAMPAMNNHPLATKPSVTNVDGLEGVYRISEIRISCLGGDWNFFFLLMDGSTIVDRAVYRWIRDDHLVD